MANTAPTLATTAPSTTGCRLRGGSALASSSRRQYSSSVRTRERMVQRPLGRQDVHEAQVQPVHRHRPGHRRERVEPADLPEPPARVARLLQQRQRQPAGRAQVPPPLLGHPLEERRLRQHAHPADAEELVQIAEGDGRVEIGAVDRRTDAGVRDLEPGRRAAPRRYRASATAGSVTGAR